MESRVLYRNNSDDSVVSTIDICLFSSDEYFKYTSVLISSVCCNSHSKLRFHIFTTGFEKDTELILRKMSMSHYFDYNIYNLDENRYSNFNMKARWPSFLFSIVFLHEYLPADVSKVICLESDVIVDGPIELLSSIDISDHALAGVPWHFDVKGYDSVNESYLFKERIIDGRVNGGVLLINLDYMRIKNYSESYCLDIIGNPAVTNNWKNISPEELLYELFQNKIIYLNPIKYNYWSHYEDRYGMCASVGEPIIIHYIDSRVRSPKPWTLLCEDDYLCYCKLSVSNAVEVNKNVHNLFKKWWHYSEYSPYYKQLLYEMNIRKSCLSIDNYYSECNSLIVEYLLLLTSNGIKSPEACISMMEKIALQGDGKICYQLSMIYMEGKIVMKDYNKALNWIERSISYGYNQALVKKYYILWMINKKDYDLDLYSLVCNGDNSIKLVYLARLYAKGRGVNKDILKAIGYYRRAYCSIKWVAKEFFDLLWEEGSQESLSEAVTVIMPLAEQGDGNASGRLARAYRDGKGVVKNMELAAKYMKIASEEKVGWAEKELMEIEKLSN